MGRTRKSAAAAQSKEAAAKKARTSQQPGIAAALAAAEQRAAATSESAPPPELWQNRPRDLLSAALTQDLTKAGEQYLQHWGDKCFMARGEAAAAARAAASSSRVQRAAAAAAESKEDADLDVAGMCTTAWLSVWGARCQAAAFMCLNSAAIAPRNATQCQPLPCAQHPAAHRLTCCHVDQ